MSGQGSPGILLMPGTLRGRVDEVTGRALGSGALLPIPTGYAFVEDGGIRFFVRVLTSLARKDEERKARELAARGGRPANPFLPYDPELFVADISERHVAILNKFNVVDRHLLIVTREFEAQEALLTISDFEALWACLREYDSLGFYNGGEAAGASQPHKHLQVVPLPLAPEGPDVPIEPLFGADNGFAGIRRLPGLPFLHAFCRLDPEASGSAGAAAGLTFDLYGRMLRSLGLEPPERDRPVMQSSPYCLLVARGWMLLVPRSSEFFEGISINSLGYAGALLVRNDAQLEVLRRAGPMRALVSAGLPAP